MRAMFNKSQNGNYFDDDEEWNKSQIDEDEMNREKYWLRKLLQSKYYTIQITITNIYI